MEDVGEFVVSLRGDENVNVIGGDNELVELVALAIEVAERTFHECLHFGHGQNARTAAGIEPLLETLRETLVVLVPGRFVVGFGMNFNPLVTLIAPLLEFFLWQGVGEAEGDEVSRVVLTPVRKVAGEEIDRGFRIEVVGQSGRAVPALDELLRSEEAGRLFHLIGIKGIQDTTRDLGEGFRAVSAT